MVKIGISWRNEPLEYLMRRRFPLEQGYRASMPSFNSRMPFKRDEAYLERAAAHREELRRLPHDELLVLAEDAAKEEVRTAIAKRESEEADRFFNQPSASTDIAYWSRMSLWSLEESTALSFGKDPRKVSWEKIKNFDQVSPFPEKYKAQRELFNRAKLVGQLLESNLPGFFLAWAERMRVDMPNDLVGAIKDLGIQIADWKTAYENQKTRIAELENAFAKQASVTPVSAPSAPEIPAKPLGAKERNSLLTLVIGMATAWHGYDAAKNRSGTAKEISDELQRVGLSLSDDTIRAYLQEARELLPPPETEQKR